MPKNISQRLYEKRKQIAADIKATGDRVAVQRKWHCSKSLIDHTAAEFNLQTRKKLTTKQTIKIVALFLATDFTFDKISQELNVKYDSVKNVANLLKENGVQITRKRGRPRTNRYF